MCVLMRRLQSAATEGDGRMDTDRTRNKVTELLDATTGNGIPDLPTS